MVLVDTTVLVDILRQDKKTMQMLQKYEETISTSTICAFEVLNGIKNSYDEKATMTLLQMLTIIELNLDNAITAASISRNLRKKGITVGSEDCLIAACAINTGQTLLTRNIKHFSGIEKLKVDSY